MIFLEWSIRGAQSDDRLFSAALLKPKVDFHCRVILILTRMNKIGAMYGRSRVNVKVRAAFFTWPLFYLRT